jgi:hypothetical protein
MLTTQMRIASSFESFGRPRSGDRHRLDQPTARILARSLILPCAYCQRQPAAPQRCPLSALSPKNSLATCTQGRKQHHRRAPHSQYGDDVIRGRDARDPLLRRIVPSALNLAADSGIAIREDIAMAFFKRELSPVERFESALKEKQVARQKLADRLSIAETLFVEKRAAAEGLAVAGSANAELDRAEANMRAVEMACRSCRATYWAFRS